MSDPSFLPIDPVENPDDLVPYEWLLSTFAHWQRDKGELDEATDRLAETHDEIEELKVELARLTRTESWHRKRAAKLQRQNTQLASEARKLRLAARDTTTELQELRQRQVLLDLHPVNSVAA